MLSKNSATLLCLLFLKPFKDSTFYRFYNNGNKSLKRWTIKILFLMKSLLNPSWKTIGKRDKSAWKFTIRISISYRAKIGLRSSCSRICILRNTWKRNVQISYASSAFQSTGPESIKESRTRLGSTLRSHLRHSAEIVIWPYVDSSLTGSAYGAQLSFSTFSQKNAKQKLESGDAYLVTRTI